MQVWIVGYGEFGEGQSPEGVFASYESARTEADKLIARFERLHKEEAERTAPSVLPVSPAVVASWRIGCDIVDITVWDVQD